MLLHLWKRGISLLLLATILSSVAAADRACPRPADSSVAHESGPHHGTEAPAPDNAMDCEMMLSCGSAVSMDPVSLTVLSSSATSQQTLIAPHYTSPDLRAEAPPPKTLA